MPPAPAAAPDAGSKVAGDDFSGTNTQEADVDEPDVVKTDGKRIFAVTDGTLRVIEIGKGVTGTLKLDGFNHRLLLRGDRVLAISSKGDAATPMPTDRPVAPTVAPMASVTIVTEIDVSGAPKVMRTMEVPGRFVDARQNGATARLVIDSAPQPFVAPDGGDVDAARRARRREALPGPARCSAASSAARPSSATSPRARP